MEYHKLTAVLLAFVVGYFSSPASSDEQPDMGQVITDEDTRPEIHFSVILPYFSEGPDTAEPGSGDLRVRLLQRFGISEQDYYSTAMYFRSVYQQIEMEIKTAHRHILCKGNTPRAKGVNLFPLLDQFDEAKQVINRKYFVLVSREMRGRGYNDFDERVTQHGASFKIVSSRYTDPDRADLLAERICIRKNMGVLPNRAINGNPTDPWPNKKRL